MRMQNVAVSKGILFSLRGWVSILSFLRIPRHVSNTLASPFSRSGPCYELRNYGEQPYVLLFHGVPFRYINSAADQRICQVGSRQLVF
jgi:hypothetical protein